MLQSFTRIVLSFQNDCICVEENLFLQLLKSCLPAIDVSCKPLKGLGVNYWCFLQPPISSSPLSLNLHLPLCVCSYPAGASRSSGETVLPVAPLQSACVLWDPSASDKHQVCQFVASRWACPEFLPKTRTDPETSRHNQRLEQRYLPNTSADALMYICALKPEVGSSCDSCLQRSTWQHDMLTVSKAASCVVFIGSPNPLLLLYQTEAWTS